MKTAVPLFSAMAAYENEPRLLNAIRQLLREMNAQGKITPAYKEAVITIQHVMNTRQINANYAVLEEPIQGDNGQVAACMTITDVSSIEVFPIEYLTHRSGEAIAQQAITLGRVEGELIKINANRVIADRIALGENFEQLS